MLELAIPTFKSPALTFLPRYLQKPRSLDSKLYRNEQTLSKERQRLVTKSPRLTVLLLTYGLMIQVAPEVYLRQRQAPTMIS